MFLSANVYYDSSVLSAEEIAEQITDLGYPSKVIDDAVSSNSKQNFWVSILVKFRKPSVFRYPE